MVVVLDTVKETTTVTVQQNDVGDTLRMITITDRTRASTRDRYHDVQEKVLIRTDTIYVERESEKQVTVAVGPNTEIAPDGTVTKKINRLAQTLKWVFLTLIALSVFIIVFRIFIKR